MMQDRQIKTFRIHEEGEQVTDLILKEINLNNT